MGTGAAGRKQTLGTGDEVIVIAKRIVMVRTECRGTQDDEPRDDVGHWKNHVCDDTGPRIDICVDD